MVEPQIVILVVAGSSPVGHPIFCSNILHKHGAKTAKELEVEAKRTAIKF